MEVIITVSSIKKFTKELSPDTSHREISKFLRGLSQKLKVSNRFNMTEEFLPETQSAILKLQEVLFQPKVKLRSEATKILIQVIGDIQLICEELEKKKKEKRKDFNVYSEIIKLGLSLEKLSNSLAVYIPPIITMQILSN